MFGGYSRAPKEKKSGPFTTSAGFFFKKYSIRFDHCTNFYSIYISEINTICTIMELLIYPFGIFRKFFKLPRVMIIILPVFFEMFSPMSDIFATRVSKGLAIAYGLFSYVLTFFVQNIPGLVQVSQNSTLIRALYKTHKVI